MQKDRVHRQARGNISLRHDRRQRGGGELKVSETDVLDALRSLITREGGQRAVARSLDVSAAYINDILHGRRGVSERIANALGFSQQVTYQKSYTKTYARKK